MNPTLKKQFDTLNEALAALEKEWQSAEPARLIKKAADGGWAPVDAAWHLILSETMSLSYVKKKMQASAELPKSNLMTSLRSFGLNIVLRSGIKFKAPLKTLHPPENPDPTTTMSEWKKVRKEWEAFIETFPPELENRQLLRHPLAGRITLSQTLGFFNEHFLHHMRQMRVTAP